MLPLMLWRLENRREDWSQADEIQSIAAGSRRIRVEVTKNCYGWEQGKSDLSSGKHMVILKRLGEIRRRAMAFK